MKRYELVEGGSRKFWEIGAEGKKLLVRFGRIGTKGQTQEKTFDTDAKASAERDKLTREKLKKGYKEIATASSGDQPASTANSEQTSAPVAIVDEPTASAAVAEPGTTPKTKAKGKAKPESRRRKSAVGSTPATATRSG